jgi:hypothetical protein
MTGKEWTITVSLEVQDGVKVINCTPSRLSLRQGELGKIRWVGTNVNCFGIDFGWQSPFPQAAIRGNSSRSVEVDVDAAVPLGRFEYFVAVYDEGTRQIITCDPDLIIKR